MGVQDPSELMHTGILGQVMEAKDHCYFAFCLPMYKCMSCSHNSVLAHF